MSDKIYVNDEEYCSLTSSIEQLHADNIQIIDEVIAMVRDLNQSGGGFYVDEVSGKVSMILEELVNTENQMKNLYDSSKDVIDSFVKVIDDFDTMC